MCNAIASQEIPENNTWVLFLSPKYIFEGLFNGFNWKDFLAHFIVPLSSCHLPFLYRQSPLSMNKYTWDTRLVGDMGTESGQSNYLGVHSFYIF